MRTGFFQSCATRLERMRSVPYVQQITPTDGPAACLTIVLRFCGHHVALEDVRRLWTRREGQRLAESLLEAASAFGLVGRATDDVPVSGIPKAAILQWRTNRLAVVERVGRRKIVLVDPARGRWSIPIDRLAHPAPVILLWPGPEFVRRRRRNSPLQRYLVHLLGERRLLLKIVASSIALQILGLIPPFLSRALIDTVIPGQNYQLLMVVSAALLSILLCQACSTIVRARLLLHLRIRWDRRMSVHFTNHLLRLPLEFFAGRPPGDLLQRAAANLSVRDMVTTSLLTLPLDSALAIGYLVVLVKMNGLMAERTLMLAVAQVLVLVVTKTQQRHYLARSLETRGRCQGQLGELLSAIETIKAMGLERRATRLWTRLFLDDLNMAASRGRFDSLVDGATMTLKSGATMILLITGVSEVLAGRLSLGDMIAVTSIAGAFLSPLANIVNAGSQLQNVRVYAERLSDVLDLPAETARSAGPGLPARLSETITVEGVTFRYGPLSPLALRDIRLSIEPGEMIGIVGRSGSGKSTLARIVAGTYHPTSGTVKLGGVDIRDVDLVDLRRQLGVVTQRPHLFTGTVRANISLFNPHMSIDTIVEAARIAQVHEDISKLPSGYDTIITDQGGSLSGGQQQRLAIARAFAGHPSLLILDEATSHLDLITERAIQEALRLLPCTRIVIAHRLTTVMRADRILVMDGGELIEQGSHDELLRRRGMYWSLLSCQLHSDDPVDRAVP